MSGFGFPFGILGLVFPFFFFFIVFRIIRGIFGSSRRDIESRVRDLRLPGTEDDFGTVSRYPAAPTAIPPARKEGEIFRLADKMKGRITLSDIVIATNLNMDEAEDAIESMVDGIHVTMEVNDNGRVTYEFPEIIARYEGPDSLKT